MEAMEILRKLTRTEYADLRKKVRSNIMINSEVAWSKRKFFDSPAEAELKKEFIVGGLVLKKHTFHRCSLYKEGKGWKSISLNQLIENPTLLTVLQSVGTTAEVVLFDFSGVFTVMFSPPPMAFAFVKEGDIVYVGGKISPFVFGRGQGVFGSSLLTEDEMALYRKGESGYREEDFYSKGDIAKIKETDLEEDLAFLMDCGGSSLEITHRLLREITRTRDIDLFWMVSAIDSMYHRSPSERLYNLVKKYFYKWSETQNGMEAEDKKEESLQRMFPRKHEKIG